MDDANLKELLRHRSERQFWIKAWGSRDFPGQQDAQPGTQFFAAPQLEITFAKSKNPPSIQEGDIFLIYHVRMAHMDSPKLVCVTEASSSPAHATTRQTTKGSVAHEMAKEYQFAKPHSDIGKIRFVTSR